MFTSSSLQIGDFTTKQMAVIAQNILSIDVNYSMDMANQLVIKIIDPGLEMASNTYFIVGRDVVYETTAIRPVETLTIEPDVYPVFTRIRHRYEISRVSVSQEGGGASPVYTLEAMPKAVQQMKRDKKPGNIGGSGYEFVKKAAKKYGLKFVGEKSTRIKAGSKNSGTSQQDSVWDRITSIAQESQYVVFVADGTLYFGTQKWFLFKWGTSRQQGKPILDKNGKPVLEKGLPKKNPDRLFIPLEYPGTEESRKRFEVLSMPSITKGENDPMEAEGSAIVHRDNGIAIRPGMTVRINNIPYMQKFYLVTSVTFSEQVTDPVSIQFRTPERLEVNGKPAKIKPLPIGKRFQSEYFATKSNIMPTSSVGSPTYNDTQPETVPIGTTPTPIGEDVKARLPNSRRLSSHPTTQAEIKLIVPRPALTATSSIVSSNFIQAGNIDMWNRPLLPSSDKTQSLTRCRTLSMFYHPTSVILGENTYEGYAILERLFCDNGSVVELTEEEAIDKYESESIHHGIMYSTAGIDKVVAYMYVLIEAQMLTVLKRFPNNGQDIWSGAVDIPERARCFG